MHSILRFACDRFDCFLPVAIPVNRPAVVRRTGGLLFSHEIDGCQQPYHCFDLQCFRHHRLVREFDFFLLLSSSSLICNKRFRSINAPHTTADRVSKPNPLRPFTANSIRSFLSSLRRHCCCHRLQRLVGSERVQYSVSQMPTNERKKAAVFSEAELKRNAINNNKTRVLKQGQQRSAAAGEKCYEQSQRRKEGATAALRQRCNCRVTVRLVRGSSSGSGLQSVKRKEEEGADCVYGEECRCAWRNERDGEPHRRHCSGILHFCCLG